MLKRHLVDLVDMIRDCLTDFARFFFFFFFNATSEIT